MPLEIIGAGCSRTGTYSLNTALEILGYVSFTDTDINSYCD